MIHTVWPYLAILLLAAGIFPALERRFGWRSLSALPPSAYRPARFTGGLCPSAPFPCAAVQNRFAAHIDGMAATPLPAALYFRSLLPVGMLLTLLGYTGFGQPVATVLSTLSSV